MNLLEALKEGPRSYQELSPLAGGNEALDCFLGAQKRKGKVIQEGAKYSLVTPPPENEPEVDIPEDHKVCLACAESVPIEKFATGRNGVKRQTCNSCRYRSKNIPAVNTAVQRCRKCGEDKPRVQFPAAVRGYPKSLCYRCVRSG